VVVRGCGRYLIAMIRVRLEKPMPRVVRLLEEAGARIDYLDEEQRRIAADVPASAMGVLAEIAREYAEYVTVEVKASCRGDPEGLLAVLASLGFRVAVRRRSWILTGRWQGRAVEVEVTRPDRVRVKVGARTTATPRPPLPPSIHILPLSEAAEALQALDNLLARLASGARPA
jgi:hypothetical protein